MLVEVSGKEYHQLFQTNPHPYVSLPFTELNGHKAERIIHLIDKTGKIRLGLSAGVSGNIVKSPFSAPFGGFHFRRETAYAGEMETFISMLTDYFISNNIHGFHLILPPDIYHPSFNAKLVNVLIRSPFKMHVPDITGWVNLEAFDGTFNLKNSREYLRQANRNHLTFDVVNDMEGKRRVYELIKANRAQFGRPIFMDFDDLQKMEALWPVDYFSVGRSGELVAGGICYRFDPEICYAVFWGDTETGRPLRAMDFLSHHLWMHYKSQHYKYIDLGVSTESGVPNEGLLRFKESHNATSSLRFRFSWHPELQ